MRIRRLTRRQFIFGALAAAPLLVAADAAFLEPHWLRVRRLKMTKEKPILRVAQISDIHHKGDRAYLQSVVRRVNDETPDIVCFTGDFVEERRYLPEALEVLGQLKAPVFAVPGNHDYWSGSNFREIRRALERNGGAFLLNQQIRAAGGKICLTGATCLEGRPVAAPTAEGVKNIMLVHYPLMADRLEAHRYDLILAGHSHGGQVRIPGYGALMVPYWVGRYQMGLFPTAAGPLYVNPGIGYIGTPVRFFCRPEITIFEV